MPFVGSNTSAELDAVGMWVEGRYRVTPRLFLAARADRLDFSRVAAASWLGLPAFAAVIADPALDDLMRGELMILPGEAYLAEQAQLLTQRIPEFADAKKAGELKKSLIEAGSQHYGFSPDELQGISDARHVQVLHDAMRYRQLMAGKERVQEKVAQVNRPVVRPGAKRPETTGKQIEAKKALSRMKTTGSVDDVAAYLLKG